MTDQPTFSRAADATLSRVQFTYLARGLQYGDSWAVPNMHHTFTEYVLGLNREADYSAWLRLLRAAVMVDIKRDRVHVDGAVDDHLIDGIAYEAVLAAFLREYPPSPAVPDAPAADPTTT